MFAYDFPDCFCCMFVAYVFVSKHALCVCVVDIFSAYHLRMFRIVVHIVCIVLHCLASGFCTSWFASSFYFGGRGREVV